MPGPRKVSYTHSDLIDFIISHPEADQNEMAARYGYTPCWISLIIGSDAFQAEMAKRRDEVLSPEIRATIEEKFRALVSKSQSVLLESLHTKPNPALALGILGTASKALGYGARDTTVQVNASFVVALPPAAESSEAWAKGRTIEHNPTGVASRAAERPLTSSPSISSSPLPVGLLSVPIVSPSSVKE